MIARANWIESEDSYASVSFTVGIGVSLSWFYDDPRACLPDIDKTVDAFAKMFLVGFWLIALFGYVFEVTTPTRGPLGSRARCPVRFVLDGDLAPLLLVMLIDVTRADFARALWTLAPPSSYPGPAAV